MRLYTYDGPGAWREVPFKLFYFPAGEPHVVLPDDLEGANLLIRAEIGGDGAAFMALLVLADAVLRTQLESLRLYLPYLPGARQDRGAPLTARVYADAINAMDFDEVFILDPHSDVGPALLDRCRVLDAAELVEFAVGKGRYAGLICPDAGAEKRVGAVAARTGLPVFHGRKHRDYATGKLSGFSLEPLPAGHYLVVDDICDGGGTFVGLAEVLRAAGATGVDLFVTHGIFSKGIVLAGIDHVYTTQSVGARGSAPGFTVLEEEVA